MGIIEHQRRRSYFSEPRLNKAATGACPITRPFPKREEVPSEVCTDSGGQVKKAESCNMRLAAKGADPWPPSASCLRDKNLERTCRDRKQNEKKNFPPFTKPAKDGAASSLTDPSDRGHCTSSQLYALVYSVSWVPPSLQANSRSSSQPTMTICT
jgi:hypothetical protein